MGRPFKIIKPLVFALVLLALCCGTACNSENKKEPVYLIKVGELTATRQDFVRFWDTYFIPIFANSDALSQEEISATKKAAFDQFVIIMLINARARDLNIEVSKEELEAEISKLKADYTDSVFNDTLKRAVTTYEAWSEGLKRRLLMEKVMREDLYAHGEITPEDVERFGDLNSSRKSKASPEEILERIYRNKAENDFKNWTKELEAMYPVDINNEELEAVINE